MHRLFVLATISILLCGCSSGSPLAPDTDNNPQPPTLANQSVQNGPYRLWGEWTFFIDETHENIDVVPNRHGRFHLNALKFLEEYCTDCLEITNINNNGDSTIDLTVQITHPFPANPEYTGFDVKGIIMFNASHVYEINSGGSQYFFPFDDPFRLSWREMGDPELLNADGWTPRWSQWWDSGSELPIFNYWPGKYSSGTPDANINGFLNFYTEEERHMFRVDKQAERTYHIWLPGGPVVAGYAIEACWEPPTVTPVTDPVNDFPYSANQPEPYHFDHVINNGQPIDYPCCNDDECEKTWMEYRQWYGEKLTLLGNYLPAPANGGSQNWMPICPWAPPGEQRIQVDVLGGLTTWYENGTHQGVLIGYTAEYDEINQVIVRYNIVYDIITFDLNL